MALTALGLFVSGRHQVTHRHMAFHSIDKDWNWDELSGFKLLNELGDVGLLGNDMLAIQENADLGP